MRHYLLYIAKIFDKFARMKRGMISSLRIKVVIPIIRDVLRKIILAVKLVHLCQKSALRNMM